MRVEVGRRRAEFATEHVAENARQLAEFSRDGADRASVGEPRYGDGQLHLPAPLREADTQRPREEPRERAYVRWATGSNLACRGHRLIMPGGTSELSAVPVRVANIRSNG